MNFWEYLEKRSKRKSLEKLRQHYLEKYEKNEDSIRYIFGMDWDRETKIKQFTYMKQDSTLYKEKIQEIERQIKEICK